MYTTMATKGATESMCMNKQVPVLNTGKRFVLQAGSFKGKCIPRVTGTKTNVYKNGVYIKRGAQADFDCICL